MPEKAPVVRWEPLFRVSLVIVPLTVAFLLSPSALIALGWEYVQPGGNPIEKVHPATYLSCLSLLCFTVMLGNIKKVNVILFGPDAMFYYFSCWLILLTYAGLFLAVPFMAVIDTWLLPALLSIMIMMLSQRQTALVGRMFDLLMFANTALGIFEFVKNWRLIPLTQWSGVLGQWVYPHEWRSTSLLGHPLTNSYVTGAYMLALFLGLRFKSMSVRFLLIGYYSIGLIAFGSRGATVFLLVAVVLMIFHSIFKATQTGRIRRDILVILGLGVPALSLIVPAVLGSGIADRFIERFLHDKGSAETRSLAVDVVMSFPLSSLVLGSPSVLINAILGRFGLIAIENFWLSFLLTYGILGCVIFFPAIFVFCRALVRHSSSKTAFILIYFLACCTTSTSLASKSLSLALVCVLCLTSREVLKPRQTSSAEQKDTSPSSHSPALLREV